MDSVGRGSVLSGSVLGGSVLSSSVLGGLVLGIDSVIGSVGRDLGTISVSESEESRYSRYSRPREAILMMKIDENNNKNG